jgi:hypothetical protein
MNILEKLNALSNDELAKLKAGEIGDSSDTVLNAVDSNKKFHCNCS